MATNDMAFSRFGDEWGINLGHFGHGHRMVLQSYLVLGMFF